MEIKKESPDVETPGLLVKALISSFFMSKAVGRRLFYYFRDNYGSQFFVPCHHTL
jgi:hypothetical protein